jgi:2',3'-cyclic-nucleotide 2'-phosphodiesterase (5'-nucleotidase family)
LHFNDTYTFMPNDKGLGGFAPLQTLLTQEVRAAKGPTLITFGGDAISPTALGGVTKGAHMIELLNAVGTQVAVPGNHEFDFGPAVLQERVQASRFPWLAANVVQKSNGAMCCGMREHILVNMGGLKVGIFGLLTEETEGYSSVEPNQIKPYLAVAAQQVQALRSQGAEVIVALTHLAFEEDIALAKTKSVHLILGGHEHVAYAYYGNDVNDVLVLKVGQNEEMLGVVELPVERGPSGVTVRPPTWKVLPVNQAPAPKVQTLVKKYAAQEDALKTVIGKTNVPLNTIAALVRGVETPMGDVITDAMRQETKADVGLIHGFNFRGMQKEAGASLTHLNVLETLPFANTVVVVEMTGAQLQSALEHGVSGFGSTNSRDLSRFLQVSGLRMTYDPTRPARAPGCPSPAEGQRVSAVTVGDAPLEMEKTYRVAINDFMAEGGNDFCMFASAPRVKTSGPAPLLTDVVVATIKQNKEVNQQSARITAASGK